MYVSRVFFDGIINFLQLVSNVVLFFLPPFAFRLAQVYCQQSYRKYTWHDLQPHQLVLLSWTWYPGEMRTMDLIASLYCLYLSFLCKLTLLKVLIGTNLKNYLNSDHEICTTKYDPRLT